MINLEGTLETVPVVSPPRVLVLDVEISSRAPCEEKIGEEKIGVEIRQVKEGRASGED